MLETYRNWYGSPENFLRFITVLSEFSTVELESKHQVTVNYDQGKELATIFIDVLEVNIDPYADYEELRSHFLLEIDLEGELAKMRKKFREDDDFFDLTEEAGILPSQDTIHEELAFDILIRSIIEKLRPYIQFY